LKNKSLATPTFEVYWYVTTFEAVMTYLLTAAL